MSASTVSRARERKTPRGAERARDVDRLVVEIARCMVDGGWSHEAKAAFAKREGVQLPTVEEWASDAGRLLRVGPELETARAINLARLDETYARAEDAQKAVAAIAEQNRMLGLHAPDRVKVDVSVAAYAQLDDAAMLERVEQQLAALTQVRAKLMAKMQIVEMIPALPAKGDSDG